MSKVLILAGAEIELQSSGLTVTTYPNGGMVRAWPEHTEEYAKRAEELGYGGDIFRMSRDHELTHHLLAHWLGRIVSPTLSAVAMGETDPDWALEEAAVLAIQAFAMAKGVDLVRLAMSLSKKKECT